MAKVKANSVVLGFSNKIALPKQRYSIFCLEEPFTLSKGGSPMLTRQWEIVAPAQVQVGDSTVSIDGAKFVQRLVTKVKTDGEWDSEKSAKALGRFVNDLVKCGFNPEDEIDDENPPKFMEGKTVEAVLYCTAKEARKTPTAEQVAAGKQGDPILDLDDKPIVTYEIQIEMILGLSPKAVNSPANV